LKERGKETKSKEKDKVDVPYCYILQFYHHDNQYVNVIVPILERIIWLKTYSEKLFFGCTCNGEPFFVHWRITVTVIS